MGGQEGEALEAGTKQFEDLEFQQLEKESSLEEERETVSQQLLHERAEYHRSVARRKVGDTCLMVMETIETDAGQSVSVSTCQNVSSVVDWMLFTVYFVFYCMVQLSWSGLSCKIDVSSH